MGSFPGTGFPAGGKVFLQLLRRRLCPVPVGLHPHRQRVVLVAVGRFGGGGLEAPHPLGKAVPIPLGGQGLHLPEGGTVLLQGGVKGFFHRRVLPALLQGPGQQPHTVGSRFLGIGHDHPLPGGQGSLFFRAREIHGHLFRQPFLREGMALHKPVQGEDHVHQAAVVPLPGKGIRQGGHRAGLKGLPQHLV